MDVLDVRCVPVSSCIPLTRGLGWVGLLAYDPKTPLARTVRTVMYIVPTVGNANGQGQSLDLTRLTGLTD